jgi:hypothetical protein
MTEKVCIKLKNENEFICNEEWFEYNKHKDNLIPTASYDVLVKGYILCMEDLIKYCLQYNYEIEIPEGYVATTIYNIVFTTGNFGPDDRASSSCVGDVIFSTTDEKYARKKFESMCKDVGKETRRKSNKHFCWHTEDYATNQVIHSYSIDKSYLVTKL